MLQRVLNKMPQGKVKKAELRSAKPMKVNLSQIDEIQEMLDKLATIDYVLNESGFLEAYDVIRNADSYLDMEFRPAQVDGEITALIENLEELGVEIPAEVTEMNEQLQYYYEQANELIDLIERLKNSIGGQTKY